MKKLFVKIVACMLLVVSAFSLMACAEKPELDLDTAKTNLEAKGYNVYCYEGTEVEERMGDDAVNIESYFQASNYEDGSYESLTIVVYKDSKSAKLSYKSMKMEKDALIDSIERQIKLNENILNKYEDELLSDQIKEIEDEIKEYEEEIKEYEDTSVIGRKGKTVWYGTKNAVEASKN